MPSIYLITGFLGAGKTTFLKNRLEHTDVSTGVLINEFGKINIDSITIRERGLNLVELTNGSIFCSCLKENFIESLAYLVKQDLKEIYIESSGLSDPSDMSKVLEILAKTTGKDSFKFMGTICIVDGVYFKAELQKMVNVERQIKHSQYIVINKTDMVDKRSIGEIIKVIKGINPKAEIASCSYGKLDWNQLKYFDIEDELTTNTIETRPLNIIIKIEAEPKAEEIRNLLNRISIYFYRIKGVITIDGVWHMVDTVNEDILIAPLNKSIDCEKSENCNQLICIASKGLQSVSNTIKIVDKDFTKLFKIEM